MMAHFSLSTGGAPTAFIEGILLGEEQIFRSLHLPDGAI